MEIGNLDMDLMYQDIAKLTDLYNQLSQLEFKLANPLSYEITAVLIAIMLGLLIGLCLGFVIFVLIDEICGLKDYYMWVIIFLTMIISTIIVYFLCVKLFEIDYLSEIEGLKSQIEIIETRWGL